MIQITGINDIDNLIYDFVYGSRITPDKYNFNKVIQEFKRINYSYTYANGTMTGYHCEKLPHKIGLYIDNITYNNLYNQQYPNYRNVEKDDIIYL